jgi:Tol biopolymer transport system component/tRNA A-37 threonylcarbamoyl transferase component Bud32
VYEVASQLGEGGMGVVFRARDTKLLRDVALKVLPEHFADDPDRLQRLNREAQVLASLNHPNIAQIYGLEQVGSAGCIVMELVEGETLGERLRSGPMPLDEAIAIGKQIADGLAAAHERGIVHRDLKPANIKFTRGGVVKILDFGLAKAMAARESDSNPSMLPTKVSGSIAGAIVGTAAYMSPEQARGKDVDSRTDIWAFGCVLYEMLTAKQAFEGETVTDMLARIVTGQPDFDALPAGVPSQIRLLLETTLTKNVSQRLQHIGDVRLFLDPKFFPTAPAAAPAEKRASLLPVAVLAVLLLAALVPAGLYFRSPAAPAAPLMHFELTPPGLLGPVLPSPDGLRIAYSAISEGSNRAIWVRPIGSDVAQKMPGTDNPLAGGFWSPDGRYIAVIADGKLKKVEVSSGAVQVICDFPPPFRGISWNHDGTIIFPKSGATTVIARVSDNGGPVSELTTLDASRKETFHAAPVFLPDGKHFLFGIVSSIPENIGIFVSSLDDPKMRTKVTSLPPAGVNSIAYVAPGYLIMQPGAAVTAQRFDVNKFSLSGKPITVVDGIEVNSVSFSNTGLMFYRKASASADAKQLVWYDRTGRELGKVGSPANYGSVELSPNGDRAAVDMIKDNNRDIWVVDVARGVPSRISYDPNADWSPSWSGDGSRIIWASNRTGNDDIYSRAASGVGAEELVYPSDKVEIPVAWSRDGKYIAFSRVRSGAGTDMWVLQMPEKKESLFVESQFDKIHARISPDGHWIAYALNDSGTYQIVVQSFPDPNGGKWQITAQGGVEPKWRRDAKELYYLAFDGKLMAVPVKTDRTFEAGTPVPLFETPLTVNKIRADRDRRYDVAPDGRFLIVLPVQSSEAPVTAVVNWASGLEK